MTCELAGAKLLAPVFGTTLYVWAAVLGVTLGALAAGYYLGGALASSKKNSPLYLYLVLFAASILVAFMPIISGSVFKYTADWSVKTGSVLSLLVYMFPSLLFFGMTSPLIIGLLIKDGYESAKSAGSVYAISTLGGILFTFLAGFYFLPEKGISFTVILNGVLLGVVSIILLLKSKKLWILPLSLVFLIPVSFREKTSFQFQTLYNSDGINGQVRVLDFFHQSPGGPVPARAMLVNNQAQTVVFRNQPMVDYWTYTAFMPVLVDLFKPRNVLLLGLGGGTVLKKLNQKGYQVDVVEIDKRIKEVAIKYFDVPPSTNIIIEDGRRFINSTSKKYDLVIFDMFAAESPPVHLFTKECFMEVQNLLTEDGKVIINFFGFLEGERGVAAKGLLKTTESAFKETALFATTLGSDELSRNLLFVCGNGLNKKLMSPESSILKPYQIQTDNIETENLKVFTDNLPIMEKQYVLAALEWRNFSRSYFYKNMINSK